MAYIDALKHLEFLVSQAKDADKELLDKANEMISQSLELQKEAFSVIGKAYDPACNDNQELEDGILNQFMFMNDFDEIEKESQKKEGELLKISRLDPSGFTETNKGLHDCAGTIVKKARAFFKSGSVIAQVWSYRYGGYDMISCDLFSADHTLSMPINISAAERQMFEYFDEPEVYDMAEAVHLAGLITKALDAKVILGLGRNEISLWKQEW